MEAHKTMVRVTYQIYGQSGSYTPPPTCAEISGYTSAGFSTEVTIYAYFGGVEECSGSSGATSGSISCSSGYELTYNYDGPIDGPLPVTFTTPSQVFQVNVDLECDSMDCCGTGKNFLRNPPLVRPFRVPLGRRSRSSVQLLGLYFWQYILLRGRLVAA